MSMHWVKLFAPNIWLDIRGMGGVGLISPLEFLQLQLVIGFLDLLVQSARICQLIYPSIPFKCASLRRGERQRPPLQLSYWELLHDIFIMRIWFAPVLILPPNSLCIYKSLFYHFSLFSHHNLVRYWYLYKWWIGRIYIMAYMMGLLPPSWLFLERL